MDHVQWKVDRHIFKSNAEQLEQEEEWIATNEEALAETRVEQKAWTWWIDSDSTVEPDDKQNEDEEEEEGEKEDDTETGDKKSREEKQDLSKYEPKLAR